MVSSVTPKLASKLRLAGGAILSLALAFSIYSVVAENRLLTSLHNTLYRQESLPGCKAASQQYVNAMKRRGYVVSALENAQPPGLQSANSLTMNFVEGSRSSSRDLPNLEFLSRLVRFRKNAYRNVATKCPLWVEAARLREMDADDDGASVLDGYPTVRFQCSGKDSVEAGPDVQHTGAILPNKYCTMETCFSAKLPACQGFLKGGANAKLPVFWYSGLDTGFSASQVDEVAWGYTKATPVEIVANPNDACVFMVQAHRFKKQRFPPGAPPFTFDSLRHWRIAGSPGRNHILLRPNCIWHCDSPRVRFSAGSLGDAIVASPNQWDSLYRPGFDVMLTQRWSASMDTLTYPEELTLPPYKRPYLFFRGTVMKPNKWFADRSIAAAYSHSPEENIYIEAKWKGPSSSWPSDCLLYTSNVTSSSTYSQMMKTTTFVFAPGGAGPYSFRFAEALVVGAIPVVTEDMALPYQDSVLHNTNEKWKNCVVFVSNSELYALGDVLRALEKSSPTWVEDRRKACHAIWRDLFLLGKTPVEDSYVEARAHFLWSELGARLKQL